MDTKDAHKETSDTGGIKKPLLYLPGTVALCEIHCHKNLMDIIIHHLSFQRPFINIYQESNTFLQLQGLSIYGVQEDD